MSLVLRFCHPPSGEPPEGCADQARCCGDPGRSADAGEGGAAGVRGARRFSPPCTGFWGSGHRTTRPAAARRQRRRYPAFCSTRARATFSIQGWQPDLARFAEQEGVLTPWNGGPTLAGKEAGDYLAEELAGGGEMGPAVAATDLLIRSTASGKAGRPGAVAQPDCRLRSPPSAGPSPATGSTATAFPRRKINSTGATRRPVLALDLPRQRQNTRIWWPS